MDEQDIANQVLGAVGGKANVIGNDICMTRLRILMNDPAQADIPTLTQISGVLGIVRRGTRSIEVVFGPGRVEGVHDELAHLTGVDGTDRALLDLGRESVHPMNVQINGSINSTKEATPVKTTRRQPNEEELSELSQLLDSDLLKDDPSTDDPSEDFEDDDEPTVHGPGLRVLVINGPNINMLGVREPQIYGTKGYEALLALCKQAAADAGFSECICYQSNHEGDLVDAIQDAFGTFDGIVINPAAYTHTSVALLDAAKAVKLPIVEVHISKIDEREEFRQVSYIRDACFETVTGMGIEGYRKAIFDLYDHIASQQ